MPTENAILQILLSAGILITLVATVYYSFRYRRQADARLRGLYAARMNIVMGLMLVLIALIQMLLFQGSTLRVIIGAIFMLLGLFNMFAGLRNHSLYKGKE